MLKLAQFGPTELQRRKTTHPSIIRGKRGNNLVELTGIEPATSCAPVKLARFPFTLCHLVCHLFASNSTNNTDNTDNTKLADFSLTA